MPRLYRRHLLAGIGSVLLVGRHVAAMGERPSRAASRDFRIPVLCYHQFGEHVSSTLTVSTATLEAQLRSIVDGGFTAVSAHQLVEQRLGLGPTVPDRSVVLTIDDGYKSIYSVFFPLAVKYRMRATIFIYPSAISLLPFALTWEEISEMKASGLIDVQSHSYTHPNLPLEEHVLPGPAFDQFIRRELVLSRQVIEAHVAGSCDLLAWPYGLYDAELKEDARRAGYIAAFGTGRRPASQNDDLMALPRYIITEHIRDASFERVLAGTAE